MSNKLSFRKQWNEAVIYLRESRNYIYSIAVIFLLSSFIGYGGASQLGFLDDILKSIFDRAENLNFIELFFFILQNNLQSSFLGMIFGLFLGIFPILNTLTNGVILGYVIEKTSDAGVFWQILTLLPHGIFELPAIFISLGVGVKLGMFVFARNKNKEFWMRFYKSLNVFLMIVFPLLLIAAGIESTLIFLYK